MKTITLLLCTLTLATALPAAAQEHQHEHEHQQQPAATAQQPQMTMATVRKLDVQNGKITLKHDMIKNIGMPPMTMVFTVSEPSLLNGISEGDNVRFTAEKKGSALMVTALEKVPHTDHNH